MQPIVLNAKQDAIAKVLYYAIRSKRRSWAILSQKHILERVEKFSGIKMHRRTLNRQLAAMEDKGLVWREQRHRRDPESGNFKPEVTLHMMTDALERYIKKAFKFFKSLFGFGDLTEYTVSAKNNKSCQSNPVTQITKNEDPPGLPDPRLTNWGALGRARA